MEVQGKLREMLVRLHVVSDGPAVTTTVCGGLPAGGHRGHPRRKTAPDPDEFRHVKTTGEIKRELGVPPGKLEVARQAGPPAVMQMVVLPDPVTADPVWDLFAQQLRIQKMIRVDGNSHYGNLRGKHILLEARKHMRRLGVGVHVQLHGRGGFIAIVED